MTSRKAALVCVSCGQEITFKKLCVYLERAEWEAGATGMDHQKLSLHREQGWEDLPGKMCQESPLRADVGIAESLGDIKGTFPTRAGQAKPAQTLLPPPPQGQGTSEAVPGWRDCSQCSVVMATRETRAVWSVCKESPYS